MISPKDLWFSFIKQDLIVGQAGPQLAIELKKTLNSWSFCLYQPSAGTADSAPTPSSGHDFWPFVICSAIHPSLLALSQILRFKRDETSPLLLMPGSVPGTQEVLSICEVSCLPLLSRPKAGNTHPSTGTRRCTEQPLYCSGGNPASITMAWAPS